MYSLKKVLVCLDLSDIDMPLLQYTSFVSGVVKAEEIYFVHVEQENDQEILNDKTAEEYLARQVQYHFKYENAKKHILILKGDRLDEILKVAIDKEMDMVAVGDKVNEGDEGHLTIKLARKSPCSVLFVPEKPNERLQELLLPTDYSEYSKMAFDEVRYFYEKLPGVKIYALNIYSVPTGYYKMGKSYEESAEIMKENSKKDFQKYIHEIHADDLPVEPHYRLQDDKSNAEMICHFAQEKECDMILIGAKGHSKGSVMLLGSTTEKLLIYNQRIPIMVLKKKGETLSFLEALWKV